MEEGMEEWKNGRMEEWIWRGLSECTSHLGEYAANRGGHRGRRKRGKRGFLLTSNHFVSESRRTQRTRRTRNVRCVGIKVLGLRDVAFFCLNRGLSRKTRILRQEEEAVDTHQTAF